MSEKRLLQASVATAIVAILLIPGNMLVRGQMLPDTTPPSVSITHPAAGANVNSTKVAIIGTAADNVGVTSVKIFLDNTFKGDAIVTPANGISVSWDLTFTSLPQGTHNVTANAKDNAGNTKSISIDFVVDTAPPRILAPLPITVQADTAGGAMRTNPNINAFLNGVLTLDSIDPHPTVTNNAPALFPLGKTTVIFTSTDAAGNSASDSSSVTVVDTIPPSIAITQPVNGEIFNTTNIVAKGTVSDTTLTSVEILVDNVSQGNATLSNTAWNKTLTVVEGSHTITAKARDGAGNAASTHVSIVIDKTAPTLSITSPEVNTILNTSNVHITGTAADANSITSVVVSVDDGSQSAASFDAATGKWAIQATLTNGTHTIKATATDMAGNKAMVSISVNVLGGIVDAIMPSVEIISVKATPVSGINTTKFDVTVTGTASDNVGPGSVQVKIDNDAFADAIGTNLWSFKALLDSGNHIVVAKATDKAGNMNSITRSFTLSSTMPNNKTRILLLPVQTTFTCNNGQELKGKQELNHVNATFADCIIRGSLRITDSTVMFQNSSIRGNVKVGDSHLTFDSNNLRGSLRIKGGSLILKDNEIRGNVKLCNTELTELGHNIVKGHIKETCHGEEHEEHGQSVGHSDAGSSSSSHEKEKDDEHDDSGKHADNGNSGKHSDNEQEKSGKNNDDNKENDNGKHQDDHEGKGGKSGNGHSKEKKGNKDDD